MEIVEKNYISWKKNSGWKNIWVPSVLNSSKISKKSIFPMKKFAFWKHEKYFFVEWEVREGQIGVSKTIKFAILETHISIQRMVIFNQT